MVTGVNMYKLGSVLLDHAGETVPVVQSVVVVRHRGDVVRQVPLLVGHVGHVYLVGVKGVVERLCG